MALELPSTGTRIGVGLSVWLRTFDFRGRATRTEVFCYYLTLLLIAVVTVVATALTDIDSHALWRGGPLQSASAIFLFLPYAPLPALLARRLHDIALPGWPGTVLALGVCVLLFWKQLSWQSGGAIRPAPAPVGVLRDIGVLTIYAILLWAPRRGPNRYGIDPRLSRETVN